MQRWLLSGLWAAVVLAAALGPAAALAAQPRHGAARARRHARVPLPALHDPVVLHRAVVRGRFHSDAEAFVQGLLAVNGSLYMSTGLWGRSSLRQVELTTGRVLRSTKVADRRFAEGIAIVDGQVFQLTYQDREALVYDLRSFRRVDRLAYPADIAEGWGLAADGDMLYMSDGSANVYVLDKRFRLQRTLPVRFKGAEVSALNELEFVDGQIYANIYGSDCVVRISPHTGEVVGWIAANNLFPANSAPGINVLNGIAFDARDRRLFMTGKLWPFVFEVDIVPAPDLGGSLAVCKKHEMSATELTEAQKLIGGRP